MYSAYHSSEVPGLPLLFMMCNKRLVPWGPAVGNEVEGCVCLRVYVCVCVLRIVGHTADRQGVGSVPLYSFSRLIAGVGNGGVG